MKAVFIREFGGTENLEIAEVDDPTTPIGSEVIVRVKAAGLNRADILQRKGLYPAPDGFPAMIPGLEFAGEIEAVGETVKDFKPGDRVFGITAGGAQAELLKTDASLIVRIPDNLEFAEAAAIPEAFITAQDAVFTQGKLQPSETLLIHAVGSGVGLAALQLAKAHGISVIGTSRTHEKLEWCKNFGLDESIVVGEDVDFDELIRPLGGVDVILDLVGGAYFEANLRSLKSKGRLILVGLTSGAKSNINLGLVLARRITMIGTVLRSRSLEEKEAATKLFAENVVPLLENGTIRANVDRLYGVSDVREAHEHLESNESFGKIVLEF